MPRSMSSFVATPSSKALIPSLTHGIKIRFETKPGLSSDSHVCLPRSSAKSWANVTVPGSVFSPETTSTPSMIGTGFIKCNPTTDSGRSVAAAMVVIDSVDVFVASTASAGAISSRSAKTSRLTSMSSRAASTMTGQSDRSSRSVVPVIRSRVASASASVNSPRSVSRPRLSSIVSKPSSTYSGSISRIETS